MKELDQKKHIVNVQGEQFKSRNHIKKLIEYLNLFIDINKELIQSDKEKKSRGKQSRRYPIT